MGVYVDFRWSGFHGLGRMTSEVVERNGYIRLDTLGSPSSPLDPILLSYVVARKVPAGSIYLTFGYNAPIISARPFIVTIADLNYIDFPPNSSFLKRLYFNYFVKVTMRQAQRVLTISEFSRQRILSWTSISPDKVVNIGCGVSDDFTPNGCTWKPGYQYVFVAGNRKPHKNEERSIRAFASIRLSKGIHLVLNGSPSKELLRLITELDLGSRVHFLGWVSTEELAEVYRGAICLLFPSLYEGFGLPVVEAMSCGTPVITSNVASIPEVAGDAAILVNPLKEEEIRCALERLIGDADLRTELRKKGIDRASKYNWTDVASKVSEVIHSLSESA
jgi:glycosyltransferase involved in cell wall biosynthesis